MKHIKISRSITDRKDASLGLYFKDVSRLSLITPEEEIKLTKKIKKGDQVAINKLINANLRFVISIAKQYQNKGIDLVDLIQEGNLGLIEGAKRFSEDKGCKFISYAVWWIRQSILKAISDQCRTVRVPISKIAIIGKVNKASERFEQLNNRKPSDEELEEETNLDVQKITDSIISNTRSISLESTISNDDESTCLLDTIPNEYAKTDSNLEKEDLVSEIDNMLKKMSFRDADILRMTFGIGVQQMSNDEIGNRFGIGNERVRQLQHGALKRMKNKFNDKLNNLL